MSRVGISMVTGLANAWTYSSCSGKKYAEGSCNTSRAGAQSSVTFGATGTDGEETSWLRSMARIATRCFGLGG